MWHCKFETFKTFEIILSNIKDLYYLVDGGGESKKFGSTKIKNGFSKTIVFESFVIANTRGYDAKPDGSDDKEVLKM
ncbi:putative uncharacterized protein [Tetragenococcus halophilus subsp. halophilus]|uniref:Uncharacterized protein n=1 Tax=Tetragenococcus halophilus (strain DSM 20338 / JCM 20259 / NCIMB 9735 / NBRC 12172) TaxID=945021 RepID=A0AAN1SFV8_TETHN|nr:hypothetical protein TEH_09420 [Tetragenococcus halophilus NBRC 12172]GBD62348.1 putative uncharacterized protein [Tetragenococcus halophilus subsp. halophilus]GFK21507.1 hypothetical protein WJ7_09700 [Tetragenococcus halophilus]GBD66920.1 putative uncharacterized protein [Tetragenococcus halophilus subsp. halophilus]GBD71301.1 putative uncharacterized protein [Tetragenococcus halophilus subsp. halophilus]